MKNSICFESYYFHYNKTLSINTKQNKLNIEYFINKCKCSNEEYYDIVSSI